MINLQDRFQMNEKEIKQMAIKSVMVMNDVELLELSLQLCCDTLISNGNITNGFIDHSEN